MPQYYFNAIADKGLNLQAIFNIENLPTEIKKSLTFFTKDSHKYNQLVLLGHGGRQLWRELKAWQSNEKLTPYNLTRLNSADDPIDSFSAKLTKEYFKGHGSVSDFKLLFPILNSSKVVNQRLKTINFQALGKLAGWHNDSPIGVGINTQWGAWFAYRAIVLVKANFRINEYPSAVSPCESCVNKPCLSACPVSKLNSDLIEIEHCVEYRVKEASNCKNRCLARLACPVKKEHQYSDEQINYHYSLSMKMIEKLNEINC